MALCCVLAFGMAVVRWGWRELHYGIDDAYAQWEVVELVITYMEANEGKWPADWDELDPYFSESSNRVAGWTFQKYQDRVWIDFNANVEALRESARTNELADYKVIGRVRIAHGYGKWTKPRHS